MIRRMMETRELSAYKCVLEELLYSYVKTEDYVTARPCERANVVDACRELIELIDSEIQKSKTEAKSNEQGILRENTQISLAV